MKVSIIVLVRNREKYIGSCLESLLAQDIEKDSFEIIAVDNGSTDRTAQIIRSYPVKYLYLERPSISAARNLGINNSSAEYVAFLDSDSVADKNWLKELLKGFDHPRIAGCGGKIFSLDIEDRQRYNIWTKHKDFIECNKFCFPIILTGNAIFKKLLILEVGLFDDKSLLELELEDTDISLRLHFYGYRFNYIDSAIVYHRIHTNVKDIFRKGYRHAQSYNILKRKYYFLDCLTGVRENLTFYLIGEFFNDLKHRNFTSNFFLRFVRAVFFTLGQIAGGIAFVIKRPFSSQNNELFKQRIINLTEKICFGVIKHQGKSLKISKGVLWSETPDRALILNITSGRKFLLNETGSFIWSHMLNSTPKNAIISRLQKIYKVERSELEKDFDEFMLVLQENGFLLSFN